LNGLFKGELDVAQEIRVNQYKTASSMLIYSCFGQSFLVIFIYTKLSSDSIQLPLLEPAVPTKQIALKVAMVGRRSDARRSDVDINESKANHLFVHLIFF